MGKGDVDPKVAIPDVIMLGCERGGKSLICAQLATLNEAKNTNKDLAPQPTNGVNRVHLTHAGREFNILEVGGAMQPNWGDWIPKACGVIFVVDASDSEALSESGGALFDTLHDDAMATRPIVVVLNKGDVDGCMTALDLDALLGLRDVKQRDGSALPVLWTSARTREGLGALLDAAVGFLPPP